MQRRNMFYKRFCQYSFLNSEVSNNGFTVAMKFYCIVVVLAFGDEWLQHDEWYCQDLNTTQVI
jgi:hypothetical protein